MQAPPHRLIAAVLLSALLAVAQIANAPPFVPASGSPFPAGSGVRGVAAGDFNGDGNQDLAFGNGTVLLGNGRGSFARAAATALPSGFVAAGDFNGDGRTDLAIAAPDGLYLFFGSPSATLGVGAGSPFLTPPGPMLTADFNNDGKLDVAVLSSQGVAILLW